MELNLKLHLIPTYGWEYEKVLACELFTTITATEESDVLHRQFSNACGLGNSIVPQVAETILCNLARVMGNDKVSYHADNAGGAHGKDTNGN